MNRVDPSAAAFDPGWLGRIDPAGLFSLRGRVAIVTGAAGGLGRWLAAALAAAGARVMLTDRDGDRLVAVVAELAARGWLADALVVDLEEAAAAARIVGGTVERFGRLDVLVNNADVNRRLPMLEVERELLAQVWELDFVRCYELAQEAARVFIAQGQGGSILHVSSLNNAVGLEDVSLLGPAKAALSQLAKGMAVEFAHQGIRVNALAPGFMDTPMNVGHWTDETRAPWILDRTPMCRPGHPAELAGACLLLASDAGSFITGQTLYVDGGFTAGSRWSVPPGTGVRVFRERGGFCVPAGDRPAGG